MTDENNESNETKVAPEITKINELVESHNATIAKVNELATELETIKTEKATAVEAAKNAEAKAKASEEEKVRVEAIAKEVVAKQKAAELAAKPAPIPTPATAQPVE